MFRFRMLLVSMLLFVFCCPLASYAQIDEAAMMANAKSNYEDGGYYYATTWLERILKTWPNTPQRQEVLLMMSKAYAATGRDEKALTTVRTLLKDFPQSAGKLDPLVVKFVQEIETRKAGPYSSFEPLGLPETSAPAAKAVAEPAPAPAIPAAAEVATTAAASPSSPAPTVDVEPPPAAPVVASVPVATELPVEKEAPVAVAVPPVAQVTSAPAEPATEKAPVETEVPVKADVAAPAEAATAQPAPAKVDAAEPPKAAPVAAEPATVKAPVEANVPVNVETPAPPVATVSIPAPAKVDTAAPLAESNSASQATNLAEAFREDAATGSAGTFTLELGDYIGKNTLAVAKKLVRKAGLKPLVGPGQKRTENMLRIQVGEFTEREAARKFQKKLRGIGAKHFVLVNKQGTYRVFAGSYSDHAAAVTEQERLAALGIKSELKQVTVSVPTFVLSAGGFPSEKSASDSMAELEQLGLKGKVLPAK